MYRFGIEGIIDAILSIPLRYIILSVLLTLPLKIIRNYTGQIIQREQKIKVGFLQSLKILFIASLRFFILFQTFLPFFYSLASTSLSVSFPVLQPSRTRLIVLQTEILRFLLDPLMILSS